MRSNELPGPNENHVAFEGKKDTIYKSSLSLLQEEIGVAFGKRLPQEIIDVMNLESLAWHVVPDFNDTDKLYLGVPLGTKPRTIQDASATVRIKGTLLPLVAASSRYPGKDIHGMPLRLQLFPTTLGVAGVVDRRIVSIDYIGSDTIHTPDPQNPDRNGPPGELLAKPVCTTYGGFRGRRRICF